MAWGLVRSGSEWLDSMDCEEDEAPSLGSTTKERSCSEVLRSSKWPRATAALLGPAACASTTLDAMTDTGGHSRWTVDLQLTSMPTAAISHLDLNQALCCARLTSLELATQLYRRLWPRVTRAIAVSFPANFASKVFFPQASAFRSFAVCRQ